VHSGFWYAASASIITSVEREEDYIPPKFSLEQNFPNPFNPATQIRFSIPELNTVTLIIYDLIGRKIETLINEEFQPGEYTVGFDAANLPSGMYIYRITAGSYVAQKRMILVK
jgi:hypothetical protein